MLLSQFHDILPGSSIAMVNDEAIASYARTASRLEDIIQSTTRALCGDGTVPIAFNPAPHGRQGVAAMSAGRIPPLGRPGSRQWCQRTEVASRTT